MNVGIMGCGAIASCITDFILEGKIDVNVTYYYDLNDDNAAILANKIGAKVAHTLDELIENTDLILEVTDKVYEKYKIDIMNLTRGDEISFNATVKQTPSNKGNNVPIVLLNNIKLTGNNIHINPHVHENGRYGTKEGQFEEGKKIYEELPNVVTTGGKNIKKL